MIKKLSKVGNGHALFLDRAILELLRVNPEDPLELEIHGDVLLVRAVNDPRSKAKLEAARKSVRTRYAKTFKRLSE